MKTKILYILHLLICSACKINKEKSERLHTDRRSQGSLETSTAWTQFNSQDSSYRYWHYTGDSSFFFHPDLGLWSRSGQLAYGEQAAVRTHSQGAIRSYDSMGYQSNKARVETHRKKGSYPLSVWAWLLVIIPLALLLYRQCWRKR